MHLLIHSRKASSRPAALYIKNAQRRTLSTKDVQYVPLPLPMCILRISNVLADTFVYRRDYATLHGNTSRPAKVALGLTPKDARLLRSFVAVGYGGDSYGLQLLYGAIGAACCGHTRKGGRQHGHRHKGTDVSARSKGRGGVRGHGTAHSDALQGRETVAVDLEAVLIEIVAFYYDLQHVRLLAVRMQYNAICNMHKSSNPSAVYICVLLMLNMRGYILYLMTICSTCIFA